VDSRPAAAARRAVRQGLTSVHALAVAAALASAAGVGLISFVVLYAEHSGMSTGVAGVLLGAVSLGAAIGRVGLGVVADRRGQEPLRPVAVMLAASIAGYLLMISGEPAVIAFAAVVAGSCGWAWPAGLTLAVVQRSPDAPAWAVGVMATGLFAGATAGPLLLGFLAEQEQFALAWGACAACALLAAVTVTATRRLETASGRVGPIPLGSCARGVPGPSWAAHASGVDAKASASERVPIQGRYWDAAGHASQVG
jgi:predicted MFS family arabinose efflux permease